MTEQKSKPTTSAGGGSSRGPSKGGFGGARRPGGPGGDRRGGPRREAPPKPEFDQKTIAVRRVTRVTSGGRRFSFSVVLAIGDRKGQIGVGVGKGLDTALAIQKAYAAARKDMIKLRLSDKNSIAYDVKAKFNSAEIFMMPNKGRGVVAGSSMRMLFELAGVHDITARVLSGSKNKLNIARATMKGLRTFTARPKA